MQRPGLDWRAAFRDPDIACRDFAVAEREYRASVRTPSASEGVFEKSESHQTHQRWARERCVQLKVRVGEVLFRVSKSGSD